MLFLLSPVTIVRPTVSTPPGTSPAGTTRPPGASPAVVSAPRPVPNDDHEPALNTLDVTADANRSTSVAAYSSAKYGLAKYAKNTAVGLAGFALALATWEGILQLAVESRRGAAEHPALGRIENPGWMLNTREGGSRTRLNSLGMRSPEPTPKQPGEYRILMLGDSFTRADEVADGLSFSDRLQVALAESSMAESFMAESSMAESFPLKSLPAERVNPSDDVPAQPQRSVQVINAGKPSASPASYLYAADFHNQTFAPDSTVIQLSDSDFREDMNNAASEFYVTLSKAASDYEIVRNETFGSVDPLAQAVAKYAPQLRFLKQMSALRVGGRNLQGSVAPVADNAAAPPDSAELKALQAEDAALVGWTLNQLNQKFPNVVLVYLPAMNYQDAGVVSSDPRNAALENALEQAAERESIPLLNMRPDFFAYYRAQGTYLKGFHNTVPGQGHLNQTGHRLVAKRLNDFYQSFDGFTGRAADETPAASSESIQTSPAQTNLAQTKPAQSLPKPSHEESNHLL